MMPLMMVGEPMIGLPVSNRHCTSPRRVLTPWSDVAWPKRTQLADATGSKVHALGTALPLRAGLVRFARTSRPVSHELDVV